MLSSSLIRSSASLSARKALARRPSLRSVSLTRDVPFAGCSTSGSSDEDETHGWESITSLRINSIRHSRPGPSNVRQLSELENLGAFFVPVKPSLASSSRSCVDAANPPGTNVVTARLVPIDIGPLASLECEDMPSTKRLRVVGSPATRAMRREPDFSPAIRRNVHAMVQKAYLSTKPSDSSSAKSSGPSSTDVASSSTSSSVPSSSSSVDDEDDKKSLLQKTRDAVVSTTTAAVKAIFSFLLHLPGNIWYYLTHPLEFRDRLVGLKDAAKNEIHHFWMGSKLLVADVRTAYKLLTRTLRGSSLTRRERKQLLRTTSDLFRLVPFSMFILIPFMEFALPFALRIFPNLLPSTFQDSLKEEETMKRELKSRIAMAQFFQETLQDLAKEQKKQAQSLKQENAEIENTDGKQEAAKQEESAKKMLDFLEKAKSGDMIPPEIIIQYANYFQDDLTLDNMPRMQLINLCKYMNIPPYGADSFLRFQLRYRIRSLREDDQRILWEGINSLTKMELREACRERGMRSTGLSKDAYKRALQQWLDLSVNKNVPISLLIMSRTFFLRDEMTATISPEDDGSKNLSGLADAISGLAKDVVNEAVLQAATEEEKQSSPDVMRIRLEVVEHQNERIREEQEARDAASKLKKEHQDREKETDKTESVTHTKDSISEVVEDTWEKKTEDPMSPEMEKSANLEAELSDEEGTGDRDDEIELSTQEMEALSQLISPDPVNTEREQLKRIKAAMMEAKAEENGDGEVYSQVEEMSDESLAPEDVSLLKGNDTDGTVSTRRIPISPKLVVEVAARKSTSDTSVEVPVVTVEDDTLVVRLPDRDGIPSGNEKLDKSISRLKSKVESMVDKIEHQLTDVQLKIGEKLHFLDKDMDGILTRDEMAQCLQQVLKRELSFEEAMEIAEEMDGDEDGVFTVAEFIRWVETNMLVKYVEEGRDADLDRSFEEGHPNEEKEEAEEPPARAP